LLKQSKSQKVASNNDIEVSVTKSEQFDQDMSLAKSQSLVTNSVQEVDQIQDKD